ncbi:MAG: 50S ribosomal protein L11 methyltransferase [Ilumatobacteraceae bacterium]|nr:50S ribosomal protein L11 methyltransferase [Ilumatobacteraceae bacterium]
MLALVLSTTGDDVELASDALWSLGVVAIEERAAAGGVELWTSLGDDSDAVIAAASHRLAQWSWHFVEVDEAVADTWRAHAQPVWVEPDLVICPAWVPFTPSSDVEPGVIVLRIEPGATFGLGDHPTTMLSMRAIRRAVRAGSTVLDVGCGSGVLAVGACVLGASHAVAIDIAPASVSITRANAATNGVADLVDVSTTPLAEIDRQFDIVVANILAPTLIELAHDLVRAVAPSGVLIVSGVLADRHEHVEAALQPLHRIHSEVLDGWAAVTMTAVD